MKRVYALFGAVILFSALLPLSAFANTDKTPPKLTYLHITSNNTNSSEAKAGDKVTISLTANEKVTPIVLVESRTLFAKATNTGGNSWDASYTVSPRDPTGKVDYLITLSDQAGNIYICTSAKLLIQIVPRCQTTDGSSVTVSKITTPPADTVAPVIASHADVSVISTTATVVTYTNLTATDNVDASVAVVCTPASGSTFPIGTTTVTCNAHDAAGNNATPTTFNIGVALPPDTVAPIIENHENVTVAGGLSGGIATYTNPTASDNVDASVVVSCTPSSGSHFPAGDTTVTCNAHDVAGNNAVPITFTVTIVPTPGILASQGDESYVCSFNDHSNGWQDCFSQSGGITSVDFVATANGSLDKAVIALDTPLPSSDSDYWVVTVSCFVDAVRTTACSDWGSVSALASDNTDGKHFAAHFSGSQMLTTDRYYRITFNDSGWSTGAFGSQSLSQLFWQVSGLLQ